MAVLLFVAVVNAVAKSDPEGKGSFGLQIIESTVIVRVSLL